MYTKRFGIQKTIYEVCCDSGRQLTIKVLHNNKAMLKVLLEHAGDPKYFLDRQRQYGKSESAAQKWLSSIMEEYRHYFESGKVCFVFPKSYATQLPLPDLVVDTRPVKRRSGLRRAVPNLFTWITGWMGRE